MPPKLSRRQQDILEFIQEFMEEHQFPPTVRDIQAGCEISSTSVVDYNLHKLQQNNFLKRLPEVSRGI
ncbi:MAG: repressor LexA, partial [Dehalococcoidia bacterium]